MTKRPETATVASASCSLFCFQKSSSIDFFIDPFNDAEAISMSSVSSTFSHFCTRLKFFFNPASNSKASLSLLHRYAVYKVPSFLSYFPCEMRSVAAPLMPQPVTSKRIWSSSFFRFGMSQLASQLKDKPRGRGAMRQYHSVSTQFDW